MNRKKQTSILAIAAAILLGGVLAFTAVSLTDPAESPEKEAKNRLIFLSPSVQYGNPYAWGDTSEGDEMQLLADMVEAMLKDKGFAVLRSDPEGSLEDAVARSNKKDVGLHLALHTNASQDGTVRGCEAFVRSGLGNSLSQEIASLLVEEIAALGTTDRGVKKTATLYETNHADADAVVLLEVDFHDNTDGAKWLIEHRKTIAQAIADAVVTYYEN